MTNTLWGKWTIHCALGELIGIGAAGLIAYSFNQIIGEPENFSHRLLNLLVMVFAGIIEGSFLGYFQWRALKIAFPQIPANLWIRYTIYIAALGWFVGMLVPLFMAGDATSETETMAEPSFVMTILFASLTGISMGALFGLFQWFVFRRYATRTYRWILGNAIGWSVGMIWIFTAATLPDEQSSITEIVLLGAGGGILAGLSVGAITGIYLLQIVQANSPSSGKYNSIEVR